MNTLAKERSAEAFNRLASSYDHTIYGKYSARLYRKVLAKITIKKDSAILDLGCGTGKLLSLITAPEVRLAGVDIAPGMIAEARRKLGTGADLKLGDTEDLPWPNQSFEWVVSTLSFHHYPNPVGVLKEAARVVKPQGKVIIGDVWLPTPLRQVVNGLVFPFSKEGDVSMYSRSQLNQMLDEAGLRLVSWKLDRSLFFVLVAER
ncbi:MAG: class I SAM-dependent methyltransferase [Methylocystaceae bacterium]